MHEPPAVSVPHVAGIDLQYRPASYFWPMSLEKHLLARVKGANRKAALRQLIDAHHLDPVPTPLANSAMNDAERQALGRIHPALMGGEFLPDLLLTEVQIARITIASVTQDVTSLYARLGQHRIHYRVVDEYEGDTLRGRCTRTSIRPLALGELEAFINGAWSIFDVLAMNFGASGYDPDDLIGFVVAVESEFYPQIGALYAHRIATWGAAQRAKFAANERGSWR